MRDLYRSLALPVYFPGVLLAIGQAIVGTMLPLYVISIGGHAAQAALVVAAYGFGSLCANLPAGVLVSRYGDKAVMLGALALMMLGALGLVASARLATLSVASFSSGAGGGAWLLARLSYMTEAAPLHQRGRAIALMGGVQRLGGFVGPALGGLLAVRVSFHAAFLAALVCLLCALVMVLRFTVNVTEANSFTERPGLARPGLASQWSVLRDYRGLFATAGVAVVAIALVRGAYGLLIPLWGTHLRLDAAAIGLTFSILSAIDMLMFYPVGIIMDRWGRKWAGVPCLALIALGLALLPLSRGFWSLALIALLIGFGNGLGSGIVMTMGSDFAPRARRGEFLGAWRFLADGGFIAAPMLISLLTVTVSLAGAAVACASVGVAGALVMIFAVRESLHRE